MARDAQFLQRLARRKRAAAVYMAALDSGDSGAGFVAEGVSVSIVDGMLVADYSGTSENNQIPYVEDVVITGTEQDGETLTFTVTWLKNGMSGSLGASSLAIYRNNDVSGSGATLVETQTSADTETLSGNTVTATYTYTLDSNDVGKFINVVFTPKLTGVQNTDGQAFSSQHTGSIASNLVLPSEYTGWELALVNGGFSSGSWVNLGTDGGSWTATGTFTENGDGSITGTGTQYLSGTSPSSTNDYVVAMKFTWDDDSEIKSLYELGNNKQSDVLTSGGIRLKSTISANIVTLTMGTEYSAVFEVSGSGDETVNIQENDGTVVFSGTVTAGDVMLSGQAGKIWTDLENTNINEGTLFEFAVKDGTITSGERTDILTRLKGL